MVTPEQRDAALKFIKFAATHEKTAEGPAKAFAIAATCMERDADEIERLRAGMSLAAKALLHAANVLDDCGKDEACEATMEAQQFICALLPQNQPE